MSIEALVHVINFATAKTWQYPRKSMDIATSKCFFFHGNTSVAIETTPNLRCNSDNVLYFIRCLSCLYIHAWPSLYPRLALTVSMLYIRFFFKCKPRNKTSLQPCLAVSVSTPGRRCIHTLYKVLKKKCKPRNKTSLQPRLSVSVSTHCRLCIHTWSSLYPRFV